MIEYKKIKQGYLAGWCILCFCISVYGDSLRIPDTLPLATKVILEQITDQSIHNAGIGPSSPMIIGNSQKTFITFPYGKTFGEYKPAVRVRDRQSGQWSDIIIVDDKNFDDHLYCTLTRDSKGFLHFIYGGHGPISYCRSSRPDDPNEWTDRQILTKMGTYPSLCIDRKDTLYLTYRDHRPEDMTFQTKPFEKSWTPAMRVLRTNQRTYVRSMTLDDKGTDTIVHIVGCIQTPEKRDRTRGQFLWHLCTADMGKTWTDVNGKPFTGELPIDYKIITPVYDPYDKYPHYLFDYCNAVVLDQNHQPYIFTVFHPDMAGTNPNYLKADKPWTQLCARYVGNSWNVDVWGPIKDGRLSTDNYSGVSCWPVTDINGVMHVLAFDQSVNKEFVKQALAGKNVDGDLTEQLFYAVSKNGTDWRITPILEHRFKFQVSKSKWGTVRIDGYIAGASIAPPDDSGQIEALLPFKGGNLYYLSFYAGQSL
ncbi:MAG: BNR-4 repeat-containing protein [Sedimentisphaerales bacterium]|nr:BNR-4 repeat-containing protein [Sedimentisphaerales bacterium]